MKTLIALTILIIGFSRAQAHNKTHPVVVVPAVDLTRFLGKWYEIAVIPYFFERNCVATNANYSLRPDGRIDVLNLCNHKTLDGKLKSAHGVAEVTDVRTNAKLKVSFFEPFFQAYWIIDLDKDYKYAVTASPNRKYLWILSRSPKMENEIYEELVSRAATQGFDVTKLVKTLQP